MNILKFTILAGLLALVVNTHAQDTLYTSTGDVLIGEIKSMSKNILEFDTDYADTEFLIEWDNVDGLVSGTVLIIYTSGGGRYKGSMQYDGTEKRKVVLTEIGGERSLVLDEIVQIGTLSSGFWDRIYISIDAGFSYTKANNLTQFSMTGRVNYTADKWRLGGGFNNVATNQDDVDATTRNEGNIDFNRDIMGNAFAFIGLEFLESSEQELDLRTTTKLGMGYYFVRTNSLFFQGVLGVANADEQYGGDAPFSENSFEGLAGLEFDAYDIGDFSFRAKVNAFPSFSQGGRVRINSDVSLKWDLPFDFYIKASIVHNYDTEPPALDIAKSDYVFQTSIGWEWD